MIHLIYSNISGAEEGIFRALYEKASPERKSRADRFRGREDALRCVTADGLLRYALGTERYRVEQAPGEKPFLLDRPDFHFNISHSGPWVVMAWGNSPVGVDVEQVRPDTDVRKLAARFFAPEEESYVRAVPRESRDRFFEIWTGKESYLKYLGTGLKRDLRSFSVLSPQQGVRFLRQKLPDGCWLTLCTEEADMEVTALDLSRLV